MPTITADTTPSPWHAGEVALQQRVGMAERMEVFGRRVIRDFMPEQHRHFYQQLPFMLLGSVDAEGYPWASILEGRPGFARSPDPRLLQFNCRPAQGDPAAANLADGAAVGLLGIELHSRRRNRINGHVQSASDGGFSVAVEHAFGNCPQYIQLREAHFSQEPGQLQQQAFQRLTGLDEAARLLISGADTCFVASYVDLDGDPGRRSVDVSHRGGNAGFVQVDGDCLNIPDFAGNMHFNTLGNLLLNPRAGLLFIDFNSGNILQVSGRTEIVWQGPEVSAFQGAERLWRLHVEQVVRRPAALALRWDLQQFSPNSLMTGSWPQAQARLQAEALRDSWRTLQVSRIEDESSQIRSFYLAPTDGAGLPVFQAGQHLPIRLQLPGSAAPLIRTYSLSSAPSDNFFRISVKRDGAVSNHLHEHLQVGDLLEARAPQGRFVVDASERRPLVLLAAGVGVTPLLSMLREVLYQGKRLRHTRPTYFVQSARSLAELPFKDELEQLTGTADDALHVLRLLSQPAADAREGQGFELAGRIDIKLLKALLPFDDFDFYLCGPSAFTQDLYDGLRALRISDERIHAETFGPSSLRRQLDQAAAQAEQPPAAEGPVPVLFARSAKEARWTPGSGSLLELAEARGLSPEFSCRGGSCGTCKTKLVSGAVHYPVPPAELPAAGEVLICCAVPAASSSGQNSLVLDI
jgi:ferredoxin-NADP reductase/predicted pyridoxine 5'-phosphate oxidase superfamily flavin-nucleotide-binding protein